MVVGGTGTTAAVAVPSVGLAVVQPGNCRSAAAPQVRRHDALLEVVPTGPQPVLEAPVGAPVGPTSTVKVVAPRARSAHNVPGPWGQLVG